MSDLIKSALTEKKFLFYTLFSVMLLVVIHAFHPQLSALYNPINFLGIHIILEFFAIAISVSIFLYGWRRFEYTRSGKLLMLSLVFFIVGLVDLLHTITFKGMPFFLSESSVAKATWFWVIARSVESVSMLLILIFPERKLQFDPRKIMLLGGICFVSLIGFSVFYFEKSLPLLVIEGQGTTFLKNSIEYFVSLLRIISIVISLFYYNERKNQDYLYLTLAFTILFLSELIFTIYQSVYDIDNFSGHLFKVVGYYFILRGFYFSIEKETLSQNHFQKKCFDLIHEYQGIIFTFKKVEDVFVHETCDGELLSELGLTSDKVVGKTIHDFVPTKTALIEGYYERTWETATNVSFRILLNNKCLYVSLKPLFKDHEVVEVLGTVINLANIEESESKLHHYATNPHK